MEVDDITDWKITELRQLDNLLRCSICLEFFNTAMLIHHCSHTFCSLCIRRHLDSENRCATCQKSASVLDLRNNRLVDDLVSVFTNARPRLLELSQLSDSLAKKPKSRTAAPNGDPLASSDALIRPANFHAALAGQSSNGSSVAQSRSSSPTVSRHTGFPLSASPQSDPLFSPTVPGESVPMDIPSAASAPSVSFMTTSLATASARSASGLGLHGVLEPASPKNSTSSPAGRGGGANAAGNDDLSIESVSCPVCQTLVSPSVINSHLDSCLSRTHRKDSLRRTAQDSLSSKRQPLPKVVYNMLNDKQLKKLLKDHGLSSNGDRATLIWRHKEFSLQYNAQCDSADPRPVAWIIKQVEKEERQMEKDKSRQQERDKEKENHSKNLKANQNARLQAPPSPAPLPASPLAFGAAGAVDKHPSSPLATPHSSSLVHGTSGSAPASSSILADSGSVFEAAALESERHQHQQQQQQQQQLPGTDHRDYLKKFSTQFAALVQQARNSKKRPSEDAASDAEAGRPAGDAPESNEQSEGPRKKASAVVESMTSAPEDDGLGVDSSLILDDEESNGSDALFGPEKNAQAPPSTQLRKQRSSTLSRSESALLESQLSSGGFTPSPPTVFTQTVRRSTRHSSGNSPNRANNQSENDVSDSSSPSSTQDPSSQPTRHSTRSLRLRK